MGVKVASSSTFLQWTTQPIIHQSSSPSQTLASGTITSPSKRRSTVHDGRFLSCRFVTQRLNRSALFGTPSTKLHRPKSCELWKSSSSSSRPIKTQSFRRVYSANLDPFSDEEFSKKIQELTLRFNIPHHDDDENSIEPPWNEMVHLSSIEMKANSVDLPLSLRIIKKKRQWEEGVKQAGESACCSMNKAFSSMVFMIRELQSFTLHMREILFYEDLQEILLRVREEYFKRAVGVEPKDAEAFSKYATFLWRARDDLWAAEETFLEAIDADPTNSYYAANYANFLWNTGGDDTCFPLDDESHEDTI